MEFNEFELSLLLILVEGKVDDLKIMGYGLEFEKSFMDKLEYNRLKGVNDDALESTQLLKNKIEKMLEEK